MKAYSEANIPLAKAKLVVELDGGHYTAGQTLQVWLLKSLPQSASLTAPSSEGALETTLAKYVVYEIPTSL